MRRLACLAAGLLAAAALPTPAGAQSLNVEPVLITRIAVDNNGLAFVKIAPVPNGQTPKAACSTLAYWQVVFKTDTAAGQAMLSVALTAKTTQSPVRIVGTGTCPLHPSIESAYVIDLLE